MSAARSVLGLLILVMLCLGIGILGSVWTRSSIAGWYAGLKKPWWTPPNWLFAPVWTLLYLMMACAAWLVWRRAGFAGAPLALSLFGIQLFLNGLWSGIFLGLRQPGLAFGDLAALWVLIVGTTLAFHHAAPLAGWLMVPYLAWVTFAGALNFAIWRMNK